jgi:primosomal protein N'
MQEELRERRSAAYPPFGTLIALIAFGETEAAAARSAATIRARLDAARLAATETRGPLRPEQPLRNGTWRQVVVVKTETPLRPELERFLRELPENCVIDRNPEKLF